MAFMTPSRLKGILTRVTDLVHCNSTYPTSTTGWSSGPSLGRRINLGPTFDIDFEDSSDISTFIYPLKDLPAGAKIWI